MIHKQTFLPWVNLTFSSSSAAIQSTRTCEFLPFWGCTKASNLSSVRKGWIITWWTVPGKTQFTQFLYQKHLRNTLRRLTWYTGDAFPVFEEISDVFWGVQTLIFRKAETRWRHEQITTHSYESSTNYVVISVVTLSVMKYHMFDEYKDIRDNKCIVK